MIRLLYFASLRDRLGLATEEVAPDIDQLDVAKLRSWLSQRGGTWAELFGTARGVLAAVNQELAGPGTQVRDGDEVGFFPPVTGG